MKLSGLPWVSLAVLVMLVGGLAAFGALHNPDQPVGPGVYSRSAIGHAGIFEILRRRGVPVAASEGASRAKSRAGGLLVLAEPDPNLIDAEEMRTLLTARRVLLVLPKWSGLPDSDRAGWIAAATRLPLITPSTVLQDAFARTRKHNAAAQAAEVINVDQPLPWSQNDLGVPPHIAGGTQLIAKSPLDAMVESPSGLLLGQAVRGRTTLFILADPDVISNHGLAAGNAPFALAMLDDLRDGGPVLFDETIHGHRTIAKNPLLLLFSRPFAAATFAALAAAGLLAWSDGKRFGAPLPLPSRVPQGQLALIGTVARLLDRGGHQKKMLARYVHGTVQDIAAALPGPAGNPAAKLAETEHRRAIPLHAADLLEESERITAAPHPAQAAMAALALRTHSWKAHF